MDHQVFGYITWLSILAVITSSSEERINGSFNKFRGHLGFDWYGGYNMHISRGFRGVHGKLNVWQPNTTLDSFSGAEISVVQENYHGGLSILSAEWTVNPGVFHDMHPRIFAYHGDDDYDNICYTFDSNCTTFVMTKSSYFTCPIKHISTNLGPQYEIDVKIIQDHVSKNWSLQVSGFEIGYWAANTVSQFENGASKVLWAGRVVSLEFVPQSIRVRLQDSNKSELKVACVYYTCCKSARVINKIPSATTSPQ